MSFEREDVSAVRPPLAPRPAMTAPLSSTARRAPLMGACAVLALACAAMCPTTLRADPAPQIFVGGQTDFASFGYVGGSVPVFDGFGVRASGFAGTYQYDGGPTGPTGRVRGDFSGADLEVIYQYTNANTWVNAGVGASYIDTQLTPFDPGNRRHGGQTEAIFTLDGGHVWGPWRVDGYGSYGELLDDYSVRGSLTHTLSRLWRAGLESSADGDPTYDEERVGPLAALRIGPSSEAAISAGVAHQSGRGDGGYVRLAFNHSF